MANDLSVNQELYFMSLAYEEAKKAKSMGEVPIGAIIVHKNQIVGQGHNLREKDQDATAHAELIAIQEACHTLKSWRLWDCQLFVTIEPCMMCSGAIINSQLPEVYFGARDPKAGMVQSLYQLLNDRRLNHQVQVHEGLFQKEASQIMQSFFREIRARRKNIKKSKQISRNSE
ncbi:tRNA adenosine(34) deaminase TadA [Pediococcus parvulus]|jgi:tRNA(adenine34) deaminase|uniref:tRNA adenosine(34) deaminase TadA n=1 Tax=Pediococcus parvulus TaxID=54062 RepID=UPI00070E208E|nr:tRNA adenosine(34) deaminase TadA [Pediococcus parvulus]MCT3027239.1 nucleoside deaminase [Pediococcus parvulus]MDN5575335.1 tRNA adenosine(34) deaminase TadA [Pediococcus sp.]GEL89968.1 tRNA-specific adenosine deaminase [Pediococcus parvulus]GHC05184.1 tRNA-specific adenosine deaminase [Pediococcus parvulus]